SPERRPEVIQHTQEFIQRFFPSTEILLRDVHDGGEYRYPASAAITAPPAGWNDANGIIAKDTQLFSWAHARSGNTEVMILAPLSREFLSNLQSGIGQVNLDFSESPGGLRSAPAGTAPAARIPPKNNFLDMQVNWGSLVPVMFWNSPGRKNERGLLLVHTRMSAVLSTVFANNIS